MGYIPSTQSPVQLFLCRRKKLKILTGTGTGSVIITVSHLCSCHVLISRPVVALTTIRFGLDREREKEKQRPHLQMCSVGLLTQEKTIGQIDGNLLPVTIPTCRSNLQTNGQDAHCGRWRCDGRDECICQGTGHSHTCQRFKISSAAALIAGLPLISDTRKLSQASHRQKNCIIRPGPGFYVLGLPGPETEAAKILQRVCSKCRGITELAFARHAI